MKTIAFLQLIGILQLVSLSRQQIEISNCEGTCTTILECTPIYRDYLVLFTQNRIKFCNLTTSTVCCPNPIEIQKEDPKVQRFFERECKAYNDEVFARCEPQEFIVGGVKAKPKEFPHMALLGAEREDNASIKWLCGGTLISRRFVLSAAHCFNSDPEPNRVRLGDIDYSTSLDNAQPQDFIIDSYILHPHFDFKNLYNDIVLIKLDRDAQLNQYVVPACLPSSNGTEYKHFTAAGWGATKAGEGGTTFLQKVNIERFDDEECKGLIDVPSSLSDGFHIRSQLCAGSRVNSSDTCNGDSGGPIFVRHPSYSCMFQVVGITSVGQGGCGIKNVPAVYVRTSIYVNWIEQNVWKIGSK